MTGLQYAAGPNWDSETDDFVVSYGDDSANLVRLQNAAGTEDAVVSYETNKTYIGLIC